MSNKSLFEKLFEEVMESDEQALGIEPNAEAGGEMGGGDFGQEEGGDEVTLTLDRSTAQALYDMLGGVLGGGEEEMGEEGGEMGGEGGEGSEMGGEENFGDESAESWDKEEKEEDSEESEGSEDSEDSEEGELKESPQSQYVPFNNKGESLRNRNQVVSGALAAKTSGQGKAEKTAQTPGTEKYMPFTNKYDDGKSMKANGRAANVSGPSKSVFHP